MVALLRPWSLPGLGPSYVCRAKPTLHSSSTASFVWAPWKAPECLGFALQPGCSGSSLCRTLSHVLTSDCSWAIQFHEGAGPSIIPWAAGALSCHLCCYSGWPVQGDVAMQGFPLQWIPSTVEQTRQPAFTEFYAGSEATKMEPAAAQPPISAPNAEDEGMQGWSLALGVRCPACQCAQLVCKLRVPALESLAQSSCTC